MPLQTSGAIQMANVANEFGGSTPHSLSEYYGVAAGVPASGTISLSDFYGTSATAPFLIGTLSPSSSSSWRTQNFDISYYAGQTGRFAFRYQNGSGSGGASSFVGDFQLDYISETRVNSTPIVIGSFELTSQSFETSVTNTSDYTAITSWISVSLGTLSDRWNRDSGGTPSSGTGIASAYNGNYYVYAETSGSSTYNRYYWLRSPEVTLSSIADDLFFAYGALGTNIGTLSVYWIPVVTQTTVVTAGDNGYYSYGGWADNVQRTSTNTLNIGSATGKLLIDGSDITGIAGITNPGRSGVDIWATGSGGNSGWTDVTVTGTVNGSSATGSFTRANCTYVADTNNLSNWDRYWVNNYGGSSTNTYTGTHPQRIIFGRTGTPQTIVNQQSTWVFA